jgi:hypothetical protein
MWKQKALKFYACQKVGCRSKFWAGEYCFILLDRLNTVIPGIAPLFYIVGQA